MAVSWVAFAAVAAVDEPHTVAPGKRDVKLFFDRSVAGAFFQNNESRRLTFGEQVPQPRATTVYAFGSSRFAQVAAESAMRINRLPDVPDFAGWIGQRVNERRHAASCISRRTFRS